jgi:hypothetical protein
MTMALCSHTSLLAAIALMTRAAMASELAVGIARMIVVAGFRCLDRRELVRREAVFIGVVRILDDRELFGYLRL